MHITVPYVVRLVALSHFFLEMKVYSVLAIGTGVFPLEPLLHTIFVEPMQTRQDQVLITVIVVEEADSARLVFF